MAGLIPQAFIDDLLHRVDIVEVVARRVPELKKKGKNHSARCPFHQENTPSFSVNEDRQFYYCFGCGAGGNAIGFVMAYDQLDFPQAVEALARDAGMEVPREQSAEDSQRESENQQLLAVLERANKYYQLQLRQHPQRGEAVDYLKLRGVSGEIARDFGLGFAPPGWDNLLKAIRSEPADEQALLKAGLIIQKENTKDQEGQRSQQDNRAYYDRFRHRILFPIRDTRGRTLGFGGRVLGDDKPKYLNSPETPVFHKGSELYGLFEAKRAGNKLERVLIVEGYMDVIALAQMGIRNAVATLGTATGTRHLTRLFRLTPEVVFCFDGDEAGRTAAWRALETALPLLTDGRVVRFLFLPEGSDPDTYVREFGRERFDQAVAKARPLEEFFYGKLADNLDLKTIEGRARLSNLAKPLLRKLPRGVYARLMQDRLGELLGVSGNALEELMQEPTPADRDPEPPPAQPQAQSPRPARRHDARRQEPGLNRNQRPLSLKAIELLLRNPEVALALEQDLAPLQQAEDESRKLLLRLIEMVNRDPHTQTYTLLGYCYGSSLGGQLTQLMDSESITPPEGIEAEFKQIIDSILADIRHKLRVLQIRDAVRVKLAATKDHN